MEPVRADVPTRSRALRLMYGYTAVTAGGAGLLILAAPRLAANLLGYPPLEPLLLGVVGSTFVAFAALSLLGLREPVRFAPVLLLQFVYKCVWFAAVIVPRALTGALPSYALLTSVLFAVYVVGDLIALPFRALLRPAGAEAGAVRPPQARRGSPPSAPDVAP